MTWALCRELAAQVCGDGLRETAKYIGQDLTPTPAMPWGSQGLAGT